MDNFSNLMMIGECLLDRERTLLFKKAIENTVRPGDIVVDAGTGSGILAMFAAKAGAKQVYAIEKDKEILKIADKNFKRNGFSNIEALNADMIGVSLPHADVVIMEMMDTGLIAEQQIPALNNLIGKGVITNTTRVIPTKYKTYIEFCDYNFEFYEYDVELKMIIQARNTGVMQHIKDVFTPKIETSELSSNEVSDLNVSENVEFTSTKDGISNAIIMTMKTCLTDNLEVWGTNDMNMPVIIPIEEKKLEKDKSYKFFIKYKLAEGYTSIETKWQQ